MSVIRKLSFLITAAMLAAALSGCVKNGDNNYSDPDEQVNRDEQIVEVNKQLTTISEARQGSSPIYSKLRPFRGVRQILTPGPA